MRPWWGPVEPSNVECECPPTRSETAHVGACESRPTLALCLRLSEADRCFVAVGRHRLFLVCFSCYLQVSTRLGPPFSFCPLLSPFPRSFTRWNKPGFGLGACVFVSGIHSFSSLLLLLRHSLSFRLFFLWHASLVRFVFRHPGSQVDLARLYVHSDAFDKWGKATRRGSSLWIRLIVKGEGAGGTEGHPSFSTTDSRGEK